MLVKEAGEPAKAVVVYGNAMKTPEYAAWPYRQVLERRIAQAAANVEVFRRAESAPGGPAMTIRSA